MTFITEKIRAAVTTAAAAERPLMDLKWTWIGTAAICAFFVGVREYEQMFGWKAGMDSYSGEFQTYWMPILYVLGTVELIAFLALVFYLWRTRDLDVANVAPREELRRIFYLLGWILLYPLLGRQLLRRTRGGLESGACPRFRLHAREHHPILCRRSNLHHHGHRWLPLCKDTPADLCLQGLVGRLCSPVHRAAHASAMRGSQRMGEHILDYGRTGRCAAPLGIRVFWLGFPRGIWRVASDHRPNPGALLRV